jgi:antitoxin MazE
MLAKVQKWGNSLALRLPKVLADEVDVHLDSPVEITVRDHIICIQPLRRKVILDLDDLLAGVTSDNLHGETDSGNPIGKEVW